MEKMKALLPIIIVSFTFCSTHSQTSAIVLPDLSFDTTMIAVIPFAVKNFYGELDSTNTPSILTQEDITELEILFNKSVKEHDSALNAKDRKYYTIGDQSLYKRQYVCYKNKNGEKIVYIDCFCTAYEGWHKEMMVIDDGGKCFFNLKINLNTKKYFDFMVNGEA